MKTSKLFSVLILATACTMLSACVTPTVPDEIATSLSSLQKEMQLGRAKIVSTTAALRNLRDNAGADVKPQFTTYTENLSALESKAGGVKVVGAMANDKSAAYFQEWEQSLTQVHDQQLKKTSEDHRQQVVAQYAALQEKIQKLKDAYRPYYENLSDVRTIMKANLSAQGAATARPAMDKAISQESGVLDKLDDVTKTIGEMVGS